MATANNKPSTVISIITPEEVKLSGEKYFLLLKRALGLKFSDEGNNRKAIENILRCLSNEFARSIGVTPMSINTLKEEMTLIMDLLAMMEETEVLDSIVSQSASEEQQH